LRDFLLSMLKSIVTIVKGIGFAALSFVLVFGIFLSGFFVGTKSNQVPFSSDSGEANALSAADLKPFWKTWSIIDDKYVAPSSTVQSTETERVYGAIEGMVDSLGDPYTVFLPPQDNDDFQESIRGNFQGVGMEVGMKDGLIVVIAPLKDTPAERAGIRPGDNRRYYSYQRCS
jgi:carboxyl-terminal processing protease